MTEKDLVLEVARQLFKTARPDMCMCQASDTVRAFYRKLARSVIARWHLSDLEMSA